MKDSNRLIKCRITGIIFFLLMVFVISCQNRVVYYQREGHGLRLLESELKQQHQILNHGFRSRDSASSVKVSLTDTIQLSKDTVIYKFEYIATLPSGEAMPLSVPHEGIYDYLGKQLPDIVLPDLDGNLIDLGQYRGKPLVLNFWFRNCTPCMEEMPRLNRIKKRYASDVSFVAICLNGIVELKGFFEYHDFDYSHLVDGKKVAQQLGIIAYPKNIVLNRNGEVSQILDALLETMDDDKKIYPGEGAELIREIEKVLSS